jgi:hypothetical protein
VQFDPSPMAAVDPDAACLRHSEKQMRTHEANIEAKTSFFFLRLTRVSMP